jgi:hypothetical protein
MKLYSAADLHSNNHFLTISRRRLDAKPLRAVVTRSQTSAHQHCAPDWQAQGRRLSYSGRVIYGLPGRPSSASSSGDFSSGFASHCTRRRC